MRKKRDYKKEYKRDHSSRKSKVDRASRNKVRRQALRAGKVKKGDAKDIHHVDGNPRNNSKKNLRVVKRSTNRSKK
ncbi:MAG TPA: HNH endonuclease [Synechococcus sp. UBA8071]|nr:HNH endonuclease [Synechococcus sp. UBA8071]